MPQAIVTSPLPPERLNQIAAAKLNALGVRPQLDVEQQVLRGELPFKLGKVVHPGNNTALTSAPFTVLGHDHVHFVSAPLAALGPVMFYDLASTDTLEERIASTLHQHLSSMAGAADRLKRLRVNARFDADRLQIVATLSTVSHAFELTVGAGRTWVSRVTPVGGRTVVLPEPSHTVDLGAFQKLVDLELHLSDLVPALLESAAKPRAAAEPASAARRAPQLEVVPAPRDAVTLGMLVQHLGAGAVFNAGEVSQEFTFDRATYRFSATHVSGSTFKGRLTGPQGEKWSDRFDVLRFPGIASVVATVLGTKAPASEAAAQTTGTAAPTASPFPSHLVPHVGEVWVMNVIVERQDASEVRYACTNIDGKPFGAARILRRQEFEDIFVQSGGGWRLLIQMEEVRPDHSIVYRQLDARRQPRGEPKRMEGAILITTFIPEAMAY